MKTFLKMKAFTLMLCLLLPVSAALCACGGNPQESGAASGTSAADTNAAASETSASDTNAAASETSASGTTASQTTASADNGFSFSILNTGKSDCILFFSGSSCIVLDTADADDYSHIKEALSERGVESIDALILSHYDKDHIGSAALLLQDYPVGIIYGPDHSESSEPYNEMYKALTKYNVTFEKLKAKESRSLQLGDASFTLEAPEEALYEDDNDYTVIVSVERGEESYLFLGDALKTRLKEFQDEAKQEYALVKLPHHGDYYKALGEFIESTSIDTAVICAEENGDTIEEKLILALSDKGIQTLYTYDGDIEVSSQPFAYAQEH